VDGDRKGTPVFLSIVRALTFSAVLFFMHCTVV
jgi:hypothetical protein